jgi:hypothetical protein
MIYLQRFIDRIQGADARGHRDINVTVGDAKAMHAELTKILLEIQILREQLQKSTEDNQVITVDVTGGSF